MLVSNTRRFAAVASPLFLLAATLGLSCSGDGTPPKPDTGNSTGGTGDGGTGGGFGGSGGGSGGSGGRGGSGGTGGGGTTTGGTGGGTGGSGGGPAGRDGGAAGAGGAMASRDGAAVGTGGTGPGGAGGGTAGTGGSAAEGCTPGGPVPELKRTMVAQGLNNPTEIVGDPDDPEALLVLEHEVGDVRVVKGGTKLEGPPLAHVATMSRGNDEEGLHSIAIDPDYKNNKKFYLFYSAAGNSATTVDEFKRTGPNTSEKVRNVYTSPSAAMYHNGGQLDFYKGELYISVGENQSPAQSQVPNGQLGRVLKLNLTTPGPGQTIALGLRNPYRMNFDPQTGDMYIADVGDSGGGAERLFFVRAGQTGVNFGWGGGNRPAGIGAPNFAAGTPIIGGLVYRGKKMPGFCGRYIWGSYRGGGNFTSVLVVNGMPTDRRTHAGLSVNALTSFGRDSAGEMYYANYGANGTIYRIDPM